MVCDLRSDAGAYNIPSDLACLVVDEVGVQRTKSELFSWSLLMQRKPRTMSRGFSLARAVLVNCCQASQPPDQNT